MQSKQRNKRATMTGELLFKARTKKGLTLKNLAKKCMVSYSTLVDLELGVRKHPSATLIVLVSSYLKISPRKIFAAIRDDLKVI